MISALKIFVLLVVLTRIQRGIVALQLERVDCVPEREQPTKDVCHKRGCIWDEYEGNEAKGLPRCYFGSNHGYNGIGDIINTTLGYRLVLKKIHTNTLFGGDLSEIVFNVEFQTKNRVRFTISDIKTQRYRVPLDLPKTLIKASDLKYTVNITKIPFSMTIARKDSSTSFWDSSLGPLIFSDQFLQISTRLPSKYLYGFGEQEHDSFLHQLKWQRLGMFARGRHPFRKGNSYGVHPFYMCLEENGDCHGVFFLNSNAMDVQLQPTPGLTFRTVGGILDFFLFTGPSPEDVVRQYSELIGRTVMPPYWALGFQLCRYAYKNLQDVKDAVNGMVENDLPLDVQFGDIDYMERKLDFTYDRRTYEGLPDYVKFLKERGIRYIIILDPGISANETGYPAYEKGTRMEVWIKDKDKQPLFGKLWPQYSSVPFNKSLPRKTQIELYHAFIAFPDFFSAETSQWWIDQIREFHKILEFDGIWIDVNEPKNFLQGSVTGCENSKYNKPPYLPWLVDGEDSLTSNTICMDSIQALNGGATLHYNVHSLYGWSQSKPTLRATQEATGKRSLVITRSTFAGSGKYAGHWLGDNKSVWEQMHKSIIGMLEFNLFGIPYVGADICGFIGNTTHDLCVRWMQLGAFYPFSRNHNSDKSMAQDPASFGKEFANLVRPAMVTRYTLLPYLYTLFYQSHTTGSTVVRPLMHEFPNDKETWSIDRQFLWGPGLLITPVLEKDKTSVRGYIPSGRWFDLKTGVEHAFSPGWYDFQAPLNTIVLHLRGGYVLPMQGSANNTVYSRKKTMELLAALDDEEKSNGQLFWDDGESNDTIGSESYYLIDFVATEGKIRTDPTQLTEAIVTPPHLDIITIFGVKMADVNAVTVNGGEWNEYSFDTNRKVLRLVGTELDITKTNIIKWKLKIHSTSFLRNFYVPEIIFLTVIALLLYLIRFR